MPPRRRLGVCAHDGCPELTSSTRCPTHQPARPSASARGYGPRWRRIRASYLARHPNCGTCGAPATDVDHDPPRQDLVAAGIEHPDADQWLHSLCHSCHSRKTAMMDGGFGNDIVYDRTIDR